MLGRDHMSVAWLFHGRIDISHDRHQWQAKEITHIISGPVSLLWLLWEHRWLRGSHTIEQPEECTHCPPCREFYKGESSHWELLTGFHLAEGHSRSYFLKPSSSLEFSGPCEPPLSLWFGNVSHFNGNSYVTMSLGARPTCLKKGCLCWVRMDATETGMAKRSNRGNDNWKTKKMRQQEATVCTQRDATDGESRGFSGLNMSPCLIGMKDIWLQPCRNTRMTSSFPQTSWSSHTM